MLASKGAKASAATKGLKVIPPHMDKLVRSTITTHKNDYSQHFVDTGERPQNFIRDADYNKTFDELRGGEVGG